MNILTYHMFHACRFLLRQQCQIYNVKAIPNDQKTSTTLLMLFSSLAFFPSFFINLDRKERKKGYSS